MMLQVNSVSLSHLSGVARCSASGPWSHLKGQERLLLVQRRQRRPVRIEGVVVVVRERLHRGNVQLRCRVCAWGDRRCGDPAGLRPALNDKRV